MRGLNFIRTVGAYLEKLVLYPRIFQDPNAEALFLSEFRKSGAKFAQLAALAGAFLAISFFVLMLGAKGGGDSQGLRQIIRAGLFVFLLLTAFFLAKYSDDSYKNYSLYVGVPAAISCLVVSLLGYVPSYVDFPRSGRLAVAMTLACFLVYGFTRLPILISLLICSVTSSISIFASYKNGDDFWGAIAVYLLVANVSGYVLSCYIESRERGLFKKNLDLLRARRRAAEDAMEISEASSAKSSLLAAVNHDLRQPIASASLYVRQLSIVVEERDVEEVSKKLSSCLDAISDSVSRLSEVALPTNSQRNTEIVDLGFLFSRLLAVYQYPAETSSVRLKVIAPRDRERYVLSVGPRLWDIVSNILSNAIKFSSGRDGARVLVFARRRADGVRVSVVDNGPGIDSGYHRKIFKEYFRVPVINDNFRAGYGLGLAIAHSAVEQLEGHEISVRSSIGKGARFDILVPRVFDYRGAGGLLGNAHRQLEDDWCSPSLSSSCKHQKERLGDLFLGSYVLLLSDREGVDVLKKTLSDIGVLIEQATTLGAALEVVKNSERFFDAIIVSAYYDGCSLSDLVSAFRDFGGWPVPVVFIDGEDLNDIDRTSVDNVFFVNDFCEVSEVREILKSALSVNYLSLRLQD